MSPPPNLSNLKESLTASLQRLLESGKTRQLILGAFAVGCALVGAMVFHRWRGEQVQVLRARQAQLEADYQKRMAEYPEPIKVVVASKDIPVGTTLGAADVKFADIPEKFLQPYAVKTPSEVVGKVTVAPIATGEQLLQNKLRRPEAVPTDATLAGLTPKGTRAVTIGVDSITGVGGFVRPGDKVDILWTWKQGDQFATFTLFQEVPVMAVNTDLGRAARSAAGTGREAPGAGSTPQTAAQVPMGSSYTVTLALTPQDTSVLLFAREQGKIQLSLRPRVEAGALNIPPANITTLLQSQLGVAADAPAPPPTRQVEIYKGLKRDLAVVEEE
jgi:pilus assembly protein CpaB